MKTIILIVLVSILVSGCGNPYLNPDTSQALQLEKQTRALERIATALERLR